MMTRDVITTRREQPENRPNSQRSAMGATVENEVGILGGPGRSGRVIAAELLSRGLTPVLTGRDAARLTAAAKRGAGGRPLVPASMNELPEQIRQQRPAVVINTIGPFATTAVPIIQACLPGSDYLDLAIDVAAVSAVLGQNDEATVAGRTLLSGAG